ncbi:hypothetical protein HAX54_001659, partial [Datura stramonium]|nr:hypothetical protein [Datura stramonium]
MGTATINYSLVKSSEILMKHRFWRILASGHCLDPASHWRFVDRDQRFTDNSPVEKFPLQFSAYHRRFFRRSADNLLRFASISL